MVAVMIDDYDYAVKYMYNRDIKILLKRTNYIVYL